VFGAFAHHGHFGAILPEPFVVAPASDAGGYLPVVPISTITAPTSRMTTRNGSLRPPVLRWWGRYHRKRELLCGRM